MPNSRAGRHVYPSLPLTAGVERMKCPIRALRLTHQEKHLVIGLESGELRVMSQDGDYLRKRLQNKLHEIGIL